MDIILLQLKLMYETAGIETIATYIKDIALLIRSWNGTCIITDSIKYEVSPEFLGGCGEEFFGN